MPDLSLSLNEFLDRNRKNAPFSADEARRLTIAFVSQVREDLTRAEIAASYDEIFGRTGFGMLTR